MVLGEIEEKRYIWDIFLEVRLRVFDDGLNMSCKRKREIKDDFCVLELNI